MRGGDRDGTPEGSEVANLGVGQRPVVMVTYPHMLAADAEIWSRFLKRFGHRLKEVWYDVHVGTPTVPGGAEDQVAARIAAGITRKRIDVVARVGGGWWVVEVKPRVNTTALGQVLTYKRLAAKEYYLAGEVWGVIVAAELDVDLLEGVDELNVGVFTV